MPHILIVDADEASGNLLAEFLHAGGHSVEWLLNGSAASTRVAVSPPDLVLLDLLLPGLSGMEFCLEVRRREATRSLPLMILTALSAETDKVRALTAGADDYVVKPFAARELIARIDALIRRSHSFRSTINSLSLGDLILDKTARRVRRGGRDIHLGPVEFQILEYLMERQDRAVTRSQLKEAVWGPLAEISDFAVPVSVGRLRKALCRNGDPDPIRTVRGEGYTMDNAQ